MTLLSTNYFVACEILHEVDNWQTGDAFQITGAPKTEEHEIISHPSYPRRRRHNQRATHLN